MYNPDLLCAEYIDHMGDDIRVVNAARVSFNKETEYMMPRDENLLGYLSEHNHWTPFAHCMVTMRETVPMFIARQRFKHTIGFAYNEVSRRYVKDDPKFFMPRSWRANPENAKQGSDPNVTLDATEEGTSIDLMVDSVNKIAFGTYKHLLASGVCAEQARMVLPQSCTTSYYVTGSLAAWARAYKLRFHKDAQLEIQELASQWDDNIRPYFPIAWDRLTRNQNDNSSSS